MPDVTYNFGPAAAAEQCVFGAARPGRGFEMGKIPDRAVRDWIDFMRSRGIERVCCLLEDQLREYESDLLQCYRQEFGAVNVCSAPITDFTLASPEQLIGTILPFLAESAASGRRVVVHCAAGMGRTGHVLAAWLVYGRGMSNQAAIRAVTNTAASRYPYEATPGGDSLSELLNKCRAAAEDSTPA
jgi:protein-tyrosine phosphatase